MFKSVFSFGLVCVLIGSLATVGYGGTEIRSEVIHGAASRRFTLEQAVETALQRNPDIQRARQEIERTKGIYIEMRSHIRATQVIFAGGRIVSQIRSADFQRDSAYYGFRNAIDAVIASVRTQFYQVLLNRALIGVQ